MPQTTVSFDQWCFEQLWISCVPLLSTWNGCQSTQGSDYHLSVRNQYALSWVQWCFRGCVPHCLTNFAGFPGQLNFSIQIWPPNVTSGYCFQCNSCNSLFLSDGGMITRIPHKTHPWSTDNSCLRVKYGFSSSLVT